MTENRVFQHLTHQKYAENYADSESGNGFFLSPIQEWFISKILLPKTRIFGLFFFRLPHRFYGCQGPPHAHWTPPGPSKPTKPPKIDFSPWGWGGGGRPINALLPRVEGHTA